MNNQIRKLDVLYKLIQELDEEIKFEKFKIKGIKDMIIDIRKNLE